MRYDYARLSLSVWLAARQINPLSDWQPQIF